MKLDERWVADGDRAVKITTFDAEPTLLSAAALREIGAGLTGERKLVGRIPAWLYEEWRKEAGLQPHEVREMQEVMRRKLLSGDFARFRVWEGTY